MGPLLLLLALSPPGDGPPIAGPDLLAHVEFLADDALEGRRSGTRGADRAARYVATRFHGLGLEPAGEGGGWFQEFEVPLETTAGDSSSLALKTAGGPVTPLRGRLQPLPLSAAGEADGEVAFAGYGITDSESGHDDYAGLDAKDRVVLVLRFAPGMKAREDPHAPMRGADLSDKVLNARQHGAAGLLLLNGWSPAAPADDAFDPFRGAESDGGIPAVQIANEAAEAIASAAGFDLRGAQAAIDAERKPRSAPLPGVRVALKADVIRRKGKARNVLGLLRGTDPTAGEVVVGAHYDHLGTGGRDSLDPKAAGEVHNGADDNASGTAALLEIARSLASRGTKPTRTLLFAAFSGEEEGLLGSRRLVESSPGGSGPFTAMLNLDMVGRSRGGKVDVGGVGTSTRWKPAVEAAGAGLGVDSRLSESARVSFGGSDHESFYGQGIPVLFFFTGAHEDYHKPSDDASKVNAADAARIATLCARVAWTIASSAEPVPFSKTEDPKPVSGGGMRAWLGTVPDYGSSDRGVRLSGTSAGSPAEKAGLAAGDVVKRIGEVKVENVHDLTFALGKYRPGEEVEVDFERGGEARTIKLTLARRGGGS